MLGLIILAVILLIYNYLVEIHCKHEYEVVEKKDYDNHKVVLLVCKKCGKIRKERV